MVSNKTIIIMDTNKTRSTLSGSPRYDTFSLGKEFEELRNFIDQNGLLDTVSLAITEMNLKELLSQKKRVYDDDKKSLTTAIRRLKNLENVLIPEIKLPDDSFDCMSYLAPKAEKFLQDNNVKIIKIEEGIKGSILDTLIQNVIDVKPPFRLGKNNSSTGHGFKDAVIWETINRSSIISNYGNIILLTEDSDFAGYESTMNGIIFKVIKSTAFLIEDLKSKYAPEIRQKKYADMAKNDYLITNLTQMIASELDTSIDDIEILSLTKDIIDKPDELRHLFSSLEQGEEYFEDMVCFVSRVRIKTAEYEIKVLIDLGSNEIEMIQSEVIR